MDKKTTRTEFVCKVCGRKEIRFNSSGRPSPGTCTKKGPGKPHSWVINRKL